MSLVFLSTSTGEFRILNYKYILFSNGKKVMATGYLKLDVWSVWNLLSDHEYLGEL